MEKSPNYNISLFLFLFRSGNSKRQEIKPFYISLASTVYSTKYINDFRGSDRKTLVLKGLQLY